MGRNKARGSSRQWGSRFDPISHANDDASVTSMDAMSVTSSTTATTDKTKAKRRKEAKALRDNVALKTSTEAAPSEPVVPSEPRADRVAALEKEPTTTASQTSPVDQASSFPSQYSEPSFINSQSFSSFEPRNRRWDHNASVFVASLPPEPHGELDQLIRDHLGKHGSIINVKFINDIKSSNTANCAFVQFEVCRSFSSPPIQFFLSWD